VFLIAPYLGDEQFHSNFNNQDELTNWLKNNKSSLEHPVDQLWTWIADNVPELSKSDRVWLAYGENDRYPGHELLAELMENNSVIVAPGGKHDNQTFLLLWNQLLERGVIR
jgi:hypothetical protein